MKVATPRRFLNRDGFTILEAMIALGLSAIGALFVGDLVKLNIRTQQNVTLTAEANNIVAMISAALSSSSVCDFNFTINYQDITSTPLAIPNPIPTNFTVAIQKLSFPPLSPTDTPQVIWDASAPANSSGIKITDMKLTDIKQTGDAGGGATYLATLSIQINKSILTSVLGGNQIVRNLFVQLASDDTGTVVKCILPGGSGLTAQSAAPPGTFMSDLATNIASNPDNYFKSQTVKTQVASWMASPSSVPITLPRFVTVADVKYLLVNGGFTDPYYRYQVCQVFSGHVTDPQNASSIGSTVNNPYFSFLSVQKLGQ